MGMTSTFTDEIFDNICSKLADGESLKSICSKDGMPDKATFYRWLNDSKDLCDRYARAKDDGSDALADDIQDIAEEVRTGVLDPNAGRVAGDLKKWVASKLKPKKYGDKLDLSGESTVIHKFEDMDDEQLERAIQETKDRVA